MRKKIVFILGLCLVLSSFVNVVGAAEKKLTAEDVIKLIKEIPKTSVYTEVEITSYNPDDKTTTKIKSKHWDDTKNGNYKGETVRGESTVYTVSTNEKRIVFVQGSNMAIEYNSPVRLVYDHDKEINLRKLIDTTEVTYKGKEKVNGRLTYHLYGKGKKVQVADPTGNEKSTITQIHPDMEIWFDVETGIVMKSKMYDNKTIVYETNVTKVTVPPKFSKDTFSLKLPSGVEVVNIDELKKKEKKTD